METLLMLLTTSVVLAAISATAGAALIASKSSLRSRNWRRLRERIQTSGGPLPLTTEISGNTEDFLRQAEVTLRIIQESAEENRANGTNIKNAIAGLGQKLENSSLHLENASGVRSEGPRDPALGVRELSHALGSPLVQIHSYGQLLRTTDPSDADSSADWIRYRDGVVSGVRLCQAILTGYRRIDDLLDIVDEGGRDLADTAKEIAVFYSDPSRAEVVLTTEGDLNSTGYSQTLLLVVAAPLLENAQEDLESDGAESSEAPTVTFSIRRRVKDVEIRVQNFTWSKINPADALTDGYSSKQGHEGIGLAVVHRIIEAAGGSMLITNTEGLFTVTISLPTADEGIT